MVLPGTKAVGDVSNEELLQGWLAHAKDEAVPKVTKVAVEDDTKVDEDDIARLSSGRCAAKSQRSRSGRPASVSGAQASWL